VSQLIMFDGFTDLHPGNEYDFSVAASSGLAVDLVSSDPSIIEVSGNKIIVHAAGTVTFTATQAGDANFNPANETLEVVIEPLTQTISFTAIANKSISDAPFTVDASSTSGLPLTFTSNDPNKAEVSASGEVTIKKAGTVQIMAAQPGNEA